MPTVIGVPSPGEVAAAGKIQKAVELAIVERPISRDELVERLGLFPEGVERLRRQVWSLELAWRVANALDVPVECRV